MRVIIRRVHLHPGRPRAWRTPAVRARRIEAPSSSCRRRSVGGLRCRASSPWASGPRAIVSGCGRPARSTSMPGTCSPRLRPGSPAPRSAVGSTSTTPSSSVHSWTRRRPVGTAGSARALVRLGPQRCSGSAAGAHRRALQGQAPAGPVRGQRRAEGCRPADRPRSRGPRAQRCSDVFFLVSGDDDLTEAVDEAQVHGVQGWCSPCRPPRASARRERHLVRAADELDIIEGAAVDDAVLKVDRQPVPEPVAPETVSATPATVAAARPTRTPLDLASLPHSPAPARRPACSPTASPPGLRRRHCRDTATPRTPSTTVDRRGRDASHRLVPGECHCCRPVGAPAGETVDPPRHRPSSSARRLRRDAEVRLDEGIRYRLRARFWERYDES